MAESQATKTMNDTALVGNTVIPGQKSLSFFGLPRELRDTIYDYVWLHTPAVAQNCGDSCYPDSILVYSKEHCTEDSCLPVKLTWLLTSKQMLEEGLCQLHKQSVWHIIYYNAGFKKGLKAGSLPLGPQCRTYHLQGIYSQLDEQRGRVGFAYQSDTHTRSLLGFITDPRLSTHSLTKLKINILHHAMYSDAQSSPSPKTWKCSLPELELLANLPQLQVFAIRLGSFWFRPALPGTPPCATAVALEASLVEAFKEEAARVGKVVVPGGVEEVVEYPGEHFAQELRGFHEVGRYKVWEFVARRR